MITKRYRLALPPQVLTVAAVPIFMGIYAALGQGYDDGWWIALLGLILFCFISGTQTDPDKRRFRTFVGFLGIRIGKWYAFDEFPELVLLSKKVAFSLSSTPRSGVNTPKSLGSSNSDSIGKYNIFELYAMDVHHQGRILIDRTERLDKVETMVQDMCKTTGLPWVSFSPGARFPKKRLDRETL